MDSPKAIAKDAFSSILASPGADWAANLYVANSRLPRLKPSGKWPSITTSALQCRSTPSTLIVTGIGNKVVSVGGKDEPMCSGDCLKLLVTSLRARSSCSRSVCVSEGRFLRSIANKTDMDSNVLWLWKPHIQYVFVLCATPHVTVTGRHYHPPPVKLRWCCCVPLAEKRMTLGWVN